MIEPLSTRRPHLVIVRAGELSLHREWLSLDGERTFDLWISYYGDQPGKYAGEAEYYSESKGSKYPALFELIAANQQVIFQYESVWLADDDLRVDGGTLNRMFEMFHDRSLRLAVPAFTQNAPCPVMSRRLDYSVRYAHYVDARAPLFSRESLQLCWPTFGRSLTGLHLGLVWAKLLGYPERGIAILDSTPVKHSRPVGEGDQYRAVTQLYGTAHVNGYDAAILAEFGVDPANAGNVSFYDGEKAWNPWLAPVTKESRVKRNTSSGKMAGGGRIGKKKSKRNKAPVRRSGARMRTRIRTGFRSRKRKLTSVRKLRAIPKTASRRNVRTKRRAA
ncbi:hypothetical protein ACFFK0_09505 [Paenibacillus chartarius]|uniref:DUF707 domain-containing protein n=1 Tax=Paenibacillus chartarius TaxID=747481 RepID=A0ABV6DJ72_9BACL